MAGFLGFALFASPGPSDSSRPGNDLFGISLKYLRNSRPQYKPINHSEGLATSRVGRKLLKPSALLAHFSSVSLRMRMTVGL